MLSFMWLGGPAKDALIRLGENLDFLALLTHCDDAKGPGKLSDFVSLRFSNIDAGVIKTAADMMMQRLRCGVG